MDAVCVLVPIILMACKAKYITPFYLMRKITFEQRLRARRIALKLNQRRLKHKEKVRYYRIHNKWESGIGHVSNEQNIRHVIRLPEKLSLEADYEKLMQCVEDIRVFGVQQKRDLVVDFRDVRYVGPCGALLIAAEIDRWRTIANFRPEVELRKWHPDTIRLMDEMGLFSVVNARNPPSIDANETTDLSFVPFRSSSLTDAFHGDELANEIERIAGPLPERQNLFRGISEAMANVADHAYPDEAEYEVPVLKNQWWIGGSFNRSTRTLTIIVFDQGVGIPVTLPRNYAMKIILGALDRLGLVDDDASRIKISMELGQTRTKQKHRGNGLFRDIRPYTEIIPQGRLRVLSSRGEYRYSPHEEEKTKQEKLLTHSQSIGGTLILWEGLIQEI